MMLLKSIWGLESTSRKAAALVLIGQLLYIVKGKRVKSCLLLDENLWNGLQIALIPFRSSEFAVQCFDCIDIMVCC